MSERINKINAEWQKLLAEILAEMTPKDFPLVSVTYVDAAKDLRNATVGLSFLEKENEEAHLKYFMNQANKIRKELGSRSVAKYTPQLRFKLDSTMDFVEKIEEVFDKLKDKEEDG